MKIAKNKRLTVRQETVRQLANDDMRLVAGGGHTTTCKNSDCHSCVTTPPPIAPAPGGNP